MRHFSVFLAISIVLMGCSHSSTPTSSTDTTQAPALYTLRGQVLEENAISIFDTVDWEYATRISVNLSGAKTAVATTSSPTAGFTFDSLLAGSYDLDVNIPNYVVTELHLVEPQTGGSSAVTMRMYPTSWIEPVIDSFKADADPSLGEDFWIHLVSKDLSKRSLGSVYFYLSTKNGIDPKDASTYDFICPEITSYPKDSVLKLHIQHNVVATYPTGTPVFCVAYASPFDEQDTNPSYDTEGRIVYPYFGQFPSSTVQFTMP